MIFSTITFLFFFLPGVLILHTLIHMHTHRLSLWIPNAFLFATSIFFYAWGEPQHVIIMLASSLINFHAALWIDRTSQPTLKKLFLGSALCLNLCLLGYFKYAKLLHDTISLTGTALSPEWNFLRNIALPLGISFYTFQGMSYLLDVYWKQTQASRSYINFSCYLCLFPQLVAGPIVRYSSIVTELCERKLTANNFARGVQRFIIGLAKKVLLADTFARVADAAFKVPAGELPVEAAWLGIACYTMQIYFDFSGYSDMAVGMGRMLGFTFPENFRYPYTARSIREFWQRWHMTLSQWFRDYLYIPLGGNRCTKWRNACNLAVVFGLCGLWHGATFGFLAWGLYHGTFLVLERLFPNLTQRIPRPIQHIYTLGIVMMGWVIFRTEHLGQATNYFAAMFGLHSPKTLAVNAVWLESHGYALPLAFAFGIIFSMPVFPRVRALFARICSSSSLWNITARTIQTASLLCLFVLCSLPVIGATYTSFIYFRF